MSLTPVQHRILPQDVEERAEPVHLVQLACERGREVEPEAVDMHFGDPVPQRIHQQLQHAGMLHVQRVAGTGVVHVEARLIRLQPIVGRVVHAPEAQRRPELVAFGRMVVDDVEDHFDARRVQRLHHRLELVHLARRGIAGLGSEEADRVVAPVVAQPLLDETAIVDERVHGHQLDGGHAKPFQVVDHRRRREPGIGSSKRRRHVRMLHREAAHVQLVDHHFVPRNVGRAILAPGERGVDDLALRHRAGAVAAIEREVGALVADRVPEQRVAPLQRADDVARVGIEQQLVRVEAMAFLGPVRAVHAVTVEHPGPRFGQVAVPDLVGTLDERDALELAATRRIEDAQLDALGMLREHGEVHAFAVPVRAHRGRAARPYGSYRLH